MFNTLNKLSIYCLKSINTSYSSNPSNSNNDRSSIVLTSLILCLKLYLTRISIVELPECNLTFKPVGDYLENNLVATVLYKETSVNYSNYFDIFRKYSFLRIFIYIIYHVDLNILHSQKEY